MRTFSYSTPIALAVLLVGSAAAQDQSPPTPIVIPSQSSLFNQNTINLPQAPIVTGQDVVRGADGTTCQSAVANGGPFFDVGVLQSEDVYARQTAAVYGRVVFPIGKRAKRIDCTRMYELEIARMRMELEVLRMGVSLESFPVGTGLTPAATFDARVTVEDVEEAPNG
ncbi:hypothetical protein HK107_14860 [Parvularcula sp. ZS-1/3]|uniref:Uncharacterized protein n=1 Tax=Parvularcula mediterranea TaxID=2732508 RepID=A0A7Y3RPU2_9PROT|nr:hypothetical protein [Parvularcula mediterranea]NNU17610.1 hypothetical protein [Parvularcula mediterranea]